METKQQRKFRVNRLRARRKNRNFQAEKAKKKAEKVLVQTGYGAMVSDTPTKHECHKDATLNRTRCDQRALRKGELYGEDFWPDHDEGVEWGFLPDDIIDIDEAAEDELDLRDMDVQSFIDEEHLDDELGYLPMVTDHELSALAAELNTGFRVFR